MALKSQKRKPGDLEIRIRPDGRVFMAAVDDAMLDVWAALKPEDPRAVQRRKRKSRNESRGGRSGPPDPRRAS